MTQPAAAQLLNSTQFAAQVVRLVPGVLYVRDLRDGNNVFVNRSVAEALGYSQEEILAFGAAFAAAVMHPDDFARIPDRAGAFDSLADGESIEFEYRMRHRDGEWRWFLSRDTVFARDAGGRPMQVIGTATDITGRKLAEAQSLASEARFRALAEAMPHFVWETDAGGEAVYENARWYDYTGLTHERTCQGGWLSVIHPDDARRMAKAWATAVRSGGEYDTHCRFRRAHDGAYRWFRVKGAPVRHADGTIVRWVGTCTDVHEQRVAEEALRASEDKYRYTFEAAGTAIFEEDWTEVRRFFGTLRTRGVTDLRAHLDAHPDAVAAALALVRVADVNAYALRLFEAPSKSALLGSLHRIFTAETTAAFTEELIALWEGRSLYEHPAVLRTLSGGELSVLFTLMQPQEESDWGRVLVTVTDVTPLREAQSALHESEARLRFALESGHTGAWDLDLIDHTAQRSLEHDRIFGYQELLPRWTYEMFLEHVVPEDRARVDEAYTHARATRSDCSFECRIRRNDGEVRWIWATGRHRYDADGTPRRMAGVVQDITERKHAEQALRRSEAIYRRLAEANLFGVGFGTSKGEVTFVNDEMLRMMGRTRQEFEAGRINWAECIAPEFRESSARQAARVLREGRSAGYEAAFLRPDGERTPYIGAAALVAPGEDLHVSIALDLTQIRAAEQALKEADRRKDEFLAMLAHELRNPLAPIRNAVQVLRLTGPKEPALQGAHDMIDRQVSHLVRLVDDLLDVSRVSRGKIQLQKAPLELATVIRQAVETSRSFIDARRHALSVTLLDEPLRVEGDFVRLAQVVCNLLNNAAKYTDEGGRISLALERAGKDDKAEAVIRVRDTGRGIDAAALRNLFDLFYQADHSLDRSEGGLGIGLSLVKSLVEMHGGTVAAYSAGQGKGSEFVVRLPCLLEAPAIAQAEEGADEMQVKRTLRVLVVDDNVDSATSMALLLEMYGHEALTAHDGEQAVAIALAERPAVVLLDIGLPKLDGYAACRAMRQGGLNDSLIIAMTGYGQTEDRRVSKEAGFDAHLVKPVDFGVLKSLLASVTQAKA